MPTIEYRPIKITITGNQRLAGNSSRRRDLAAGVLVGIVLVMLYLHTAAEPKLNLSSEEIEFAPVSITSTTASKPIVIKNVGGAVLHIDELRITGDAAAEYKAQTDCNRASLEPRGQCEIDISLRPEDVGIRLAELVIPNDSDGRVAHVRLFGTGVRIADPDLTPEPLFLSFDQAVNEPATRLLVLHSTGKAPAAITSISADDPQFSPTQDCAGKSLSESDQCEVEVTFTPTVAVSKSANLTIAFTGAGKVGSLQLRMNAQVNSPTPPVPPPQGKLEVDPAEISFNLHAGESPRDQKITISNSGDGPLPTLHIDFVKGPFGGKGTCDRGLEAHQSCLFYVSPTTRDVGQWVGTLQVSSNNETKSIPLSLNVQPVAMAEIAVAPTTLRVWSNSLQSVKLAKTSIGMNTVMVESSGDKPLVIDHWTFSSGAFASAANGRACPLRMPISKGERCYIQLQFSGKVPSASETSSMTIYSNASNGPQSIKLMGIGEPTTARHGRLELWGNGNFGQVRVGLSQAMLLAAFRGGNTITVRNTGDTAVTLSAPTIQGNGSTSFRLTKSNCPAVLQPTSSCPLTISFQPIRVDTFTATLAIQNNGNPPVATLMLEGQGVGSPGRTPEQPPPSARATTTTNPGRTVIKRPMETVKTTPPQQPIQ